MNLNCIVLINCPSFLGLAWLLSTDIHRCSIDIKNVCALSMQPKIWRNFVWTDSAQIFFYNILWQGKHSVILYYSSASTLAEKTTFFTHES